MAANAAMLPDLNNNERRNLAVKMADGMEVGEPAEGAKFLVPAIAPDGQEVILYLERTTTVGTLNQRLSHNFGLPGIWVGVRNGQTGRTTHVNQAWQVWDLDQEGAVMVVELRDE